MTLTALTTIERWFLKTCKVSSNSLARLSGENSLYESYKEFCLREGKNPVGIKQFARTTEILIARYFNIMFIKNRDHKGVWP